MSKKIKLIHFMHHLPVGRAQYNTLQTLELLDKKNYELNIYYNCTGQLDGRDKQRKQIQ